MADRVEQNRKTEDIQKMVKEKFQIILAYQIYSTKTPKGPWTEEKKKSFEVMLTKFHDFDMVFPDDDGDSPGFKSTMIRYMRNGSYKQYPRALVRRINVDKERYSIERPGALIIGEPKAENQVYKKHVRTKLHVLIQVNSITHWHLPSTELFKSMI